MCSARSKVEAFDISAEAEAERKRAKNYHVPSTTPNKRNSSAAKKRFLEQPEKGQQGQREQRSLIIMFMTRPFVI